MSEWSHLAAATAYGVAIIVGIWRRESPAALVSCLLLGAVFQAVGFVGLHLENPPVPLESLPAALSLIGWLIVVSYLLSLRTAQLRAVGPWVAGGAVVITLCAAAGLHWRTPTPPLDGGAWSHAHVLLSAGGFSLLSLASLAGLAYLAKEHDLKRKQGVRFRLPSLESLDRFEHWSLSLGFPLLTLGVVTGFAWGASLGTSLWTQHSIWLLCAWMIYLVPIGLRVVRHQHGRAPARGVVLGFVLLAFSYVGIRLLSQGGA